jgi:lycopene beta-cyclase
VDETRPVSSPQAAAAADTADVTAEVVVVGAGPAGRALAHVCAGQGLDTVVVAPRPDAVWRPTYGLWADQCAALPGGAEPAAAVWAGGRRLSRGYAVLDNASVLAAYRGAGVREVAGTVVAARTRRDGTTLALRTGRHLAAAVVVDASGQRRVLSGGLPAGRPRVEQTAHGVVVPAAAAAPLVAPGEAVFMRWGRTAGWPTFLYAVPLPGGRTLLEETSLARRPGLPFAELAERLSARLAASGVEVEDGADTERVRFAVDVPAARPRRGIVAFGVAGGMMHPATGYSVGDVVTTAPAVAAAIAAELPRGGPAAARAAQAVLWPPAARAVRALRRWGLRTLLALPPERVPEFFDTFFALPPELQHAYLSGRDDLRGTAAAMSALFGTASWRLRGVMATGWAR